MFDKLTKLAENVAHNRIAENYIIKVKSGYLYDLRAEIHPILDEMFSVFPIFEKIPTELISYPANLIEKFDMLATLLTRDMVFDLADDRRVEAIFYDKLMYAFQFPIVPEEGIFTIPVRKGELTFTTTWFTRYPLGLNKAHGLGYWGRGSKVAIVDTGCARWHEQLRGRVKQESAMRGQYTDINGHGTWCASCIAGYEGIDEAMSRLTGSTIRALGMAPEADVLCIKSLGYGVGVGKTSDIIKGIEIATQSNVNIISMSLGGDAKEKRPEEDPYHSVMNRIIELGIIPVVAAGNSGPNQNTISSPGDLPRVLTVGAYNPLTGEMAGFSSRGPTNWGDIKPDCVAPGVNVYSGTAGVCDKAEDNRMTGYSPLSGTSMATPHVAGALAIYNQIMVDKLGIFLTTNEVKKMLEVTATTEKSNDFGWGAPTFDRFEYYLSTEYGVEL